MCGDKKPQIDKFKEAVRQLETDDDEERFEEKLRKLVKQNSHVKEGQQTWRVISLDQSWQPT